MRWLVGTTVTTCTLISFIFFSSNCNAILVRKLILESFGTMAPYEAPLHGCDNSYNDVVPQSYNVFLHQGYSLGDHKQTVIGTVDLDTTIEIVFPETARHGLYYSSELDDNALAAVRADMGVEMVECNRRVTLVE